MYLSKISGIGTDGLVERFYDSPYEDNQNDHLDFIIPNQGTILFGTEVNKQIYTLGGNGSNIDSPMIIPHERDVTQYIPFLMEMTKNRDQIFFKYKGVTIKAKDMSKVEDWKSQKIEVFLARRVYIKYKGSKKLDIEKYQDEQFEYIKRLFDSQYEA